MVSVVQKVELCVSWLSLMLQFMIQLLHLDVFANSSSMLNDSYMNGAGCEKINFLL